MRIALVQLNADDDLWHTDAIPSILEISEDADLIVFPECMPFDNEVEIEEAEEQLASISSRCPKVPFIAGGYLRDRGIHRNAVFFCQEGATRDKDFKRLPWQEPGLTPGGETKRFEWNHGSCIPLICADAADNPSQTGTRMMYEAIRMGAGTETPIVVSSYGACFFDPYWQMPRVRPRHDVSSRSILYPSSSKRKRVRLWRRW